MVIYYNGALNFFFVHNFYVDFDFSSLELRNRLRLSRILITYLYLITQKKRDTNKYDKIFPFLYH